MQQRSMSMCRPLEMTLTLRVAGACVSVAVSYACMTVLLSHLVS